MPALEERALGDPPEPDVDPAACDVGAALVLAPTPGVRTEPCGEDAVLYDETGGRLHVLDAWSALLWHCFDGTASVADITADVAAVFDLDVESARARVVATIRALTEKGLLVPVAPPV